MESKNNTKQKASTSEHVDKDTLAVNIISADENVFSGNIKTITSINRDGEFDVLPLHTNFITMVKDKITLFKTSKEKKEITITNGVLKVAENKVDIIVGPFAGADLLPGKNMDTDAEKKDVMSSFKAKLNFRKKDKKFSGGTESQ